MYKFCFVSEDRGVFLFYRTFSCGKHEKFKQIKDGQKIQSFMRIVAPKVTWLYKCTDFSYVNTLILLNLILSNCEVQILYF